jgi:microfibrillar-associated protein 1
VTKSKAEAIQFVENELRNAAQAAFEADQQTLSNRGVEAVDDTDDVDAAGEKSAWTLRELNRLKRDREALIARDTEREELELRRGMGDAERLSEDLAHARSIAAEREARRGKMEFMQKYYHKGAFFQDEALLARDYRVATTEEHRNKEVLPQSLQVRSGELGRASRTKWTHLAGEDTSTRDSPWFDAQSAVSKRTAGKMGGMHDPLDRARKRKRE